MNCNFKMEMESPIFQLVLNLIKKNVEKKKFKDFFFLFRGLQVLTNMRYILLEILFKFEPRTESLFIFDRRLKNP